MPYVDEEARDRLKYYFSGDGVPETPGELNYLITMVIKDYIWANELNYQTINDILGALDGASKEFYRRVAVPYEESKISLNGDVY